ncbi:MAG TPA: carbonate dehydratase [Burkholderiaceae bacterium]|jgi:carbonic anhydrase|nr:carbonate dehydratase [Burkholderiaceae bacterium]
MPDLDDLLANNRAWSARRTDSDPQFFARLARQQAPRYLWVGCSDSRVPANEILGLDPGEVFVHRNIANLVVHTDLNFLSVLQYAVEALRVRHVMVVGHYACGGIQSVARNQKVGLADNWLKHIEDVSLRHRDLLASVANPERRDDLLCRLNVIEQVANLCRTTIMERAWAGGQHIEVHGLVYGLKDGLLRRVGVSVGPGDDWAERHRESLQRVGEDGASTA